MASAKRKEDLPSAEVVKQIDAAQAVRILRQDILPNITKIGERSQDVSTAYKAIKKNCNIPSWVVKLAIKLGDTEDYKRDHELRAMKEMFKAYGITLTEDLVDQAQDNDDADGIIPTKKAAARPRLVTVGTGNETDLSDAADEVVAEQDEFDAADPKNKSE